MRRFYREHAEALGVRFLDRHYVAGVATQRLVGSGASQRRVAGLEVVELPRGDVADEGGVVRTVLTTHSVPPEARARETRLTSDVVVNCLGA